MTHFIYLILLFGVSFNSINVNGKGNSCDPGWKLRDEKCYKLFFESGTPNPKKTELCQADPTAHAVHVSSQEENDWVVDFARETILQIGAPIDTFPWVMTSGHKWTKVGDWNWETSTTTRCPLNFTNWGPNVPSGNSGDLCIYINDKKSPFNWWGNTFYGKWNDFPLDSIHYTYTVMCEKAANGAPTDAASCDYKKVNENGIGDGQLPLSPPPTESCVDKPEDEGCTKIKRSTLMAILESCSCSEIK